VKLAKTIGSLAAAVLLVTPALAEDAWAPLRGIPVQDGGRVKPLDTFARESARRLTGARVFGAESVSGLDPVEWMVSCWAKPDRWREEAVVRISDASLRASIQLPPDRDRFSLAELAGHEPLRLAVERARQLGPDAEPLLQAANRLYGDLWLLDSILEGNAPQVAPDAAWLSIGTLQTSDDPSSQEARARIRGLLESYRRGAASSYAVRAKELSSALAGPLGADAGLARGVEREVRYNAIKPFRVAWLLYLVALVALLAGLSLESRVMPAVGYAAMAAGLALHSYGLGVRALIAGRAPVTNMYESIVFAAWGVVALGLAFAALHRSRLIAACAAGLAVPFLLIADGVPIFDAAIDPLAPVLRDNFWLTTHVLTITLGYAALFLALALGHVSLALQLAHAAEARLRTVSGFLLQVIQAGTLLLAAGTLLGGVWASYSWGRFWGWDPKETWALIAVLVYLAILHARFAGWLRDLGMAVGSIVGGLAVLMAWYGVNYVLGTGLHSYGFGAGSANRWVAAFAVAEVALVALAAWKLGRLVTPQTTAHNERAAIAH